MRDLSIAEQCIPKECKDDLVSRRQVYRLKLASDNDWEFGQALMDIPSAETERRKGEWIYHENWKNEGECYLECSECGMTVDTNWWFCPKCGCRMGGEDDEVD